MQTDFEENKPQILDMFERRPILDGHYEVDRFGNVYRLKGGCGATPGLRIKWQNNLYGYAFVSLSVSGQRKSYGVHRLIATAFLGPGKPGQVVNHKDGNRWNNCVDNLEWTSSQENSLHAVKIGKIPRGAAHFYAKANDELILQICREFSEGVKMNELARCYGYHPSAIFGIVRGISWKHVKRDPSLPMPEKNYRASGKLKPGQAREIREAYDAGETQASLARRYGINHRSISKIINNLVWRDEEYLVTNKGTHRMGRPGSQHNNAVLKDEDIPRIRDLREKGWNYTTIASRFGVTATNVRDICIGKGWKHIPDANGVLPTYEPSQRKGKARGSSNGNAILSEDDVRLIRHLRTSGLTYRSIADQVGVTASAVGQICRGRIWKHIIDEDGVQPVDTPEVECHYSLSGSLRVTEGEQLQLL